MAKPKLADKREIPKVSLKQVSSERIGSPFLTNVEQQHVREGELPLKKSALSIITDSVVYSVTVLSGTSTFFNSVVTENDGIAIKGFPEVNIYVDTDQNFDYLWVTGTALSSSQRNFQCTQLVNIVGDTNAVNEMRPNQARASFALSNQSADTHTYYIWVRWFVLKI